ncbi:MAG: PilZ domain-containing protein [Planctomycetes bacterium]|nr:PilZ domain-containing protein [Planctomycetota bacterium]
MQHSERQQGNKSVDDRRRDERLPLEGKIIVRMPAQEFAGPSENLSRDGVFFTAGQNLTVEVVLPNGQARSGQIMRIGAVRDGEFGIAVRFDEPLGSDDLPA